MSTADDLRAISEQAASQLDFQAAQIKTLQDTVAALQAENAQLTADLEECRSPSDPRVPLGMYSGTGPYASTLEPRENLLGRTVDATWQFYLQAQGTSALAGWTEMPFGLWNWHPRVGNTHLKWTEVTAGQHDAGLITTLKTIAQLPFPVYLSVQEESDGKDNPNHTASGATEAQKAGQYRAMFLHVKDLAAIHAPNTTGRVFQILADANRFPTWVVPEADGYGFDPHVYGWPANKTFSGSVDLAVTKMKEAGQEGRPFSIHTGVVEGPNPSDKANWITEMGDALRTGKDRWGDNFLFATWWDRGGEAFDTSPESLTAFRGCFQ